ncbi:MAG: cation-translocating P-type ATPase [Ilumatobacteraceae bacterium]
MDAVDVTAHVAGHAPGTPWTRPADEVVSALETHPTRGLSEHDAAARQARVGRNELTEEPPPGAWTLLLRQFANTMTAVLAVAALVTVAVGDLKDTVVIAVIVVLNGLVGFVQEHRAEQAMAALKRLATGTARVIRDGAIADVPTPDLVPGDVVELMAGDVVPADLRLIAVHGLRVDEATLTGESEPVAKVDDALEASASTLVADRHNMTFKGTSVTYGRARGVVVATGMATELGRIAALLEAHGRERTPLQRRLAVLGRRMAAAALVVCGLVFVAGIARGGSAEDMFLTAVSLAVAAIPEGLPAIVTVALALGARRMADRHAVIRRLPAVETLGSVTVICTDKTGTLTQNRMIVERAWTAAGSYTISGDGYSPTGEVRRDRGTGLDTRLDRLALVAAACNDAALHPPAEPGGAWSISGDPTEGALVAFAAKCGVQRDVVERQHPRTAELAFDAGRRSMTTIHRDGEGYWIAVKGAMASIVDLLDDAERDAVAEAGRIADDLAAAGYRVLAFAERHMPTLTEPLDRIEQHVHFLGLVAMTDPPRPEVAAAVESCRTAGITPVMITGDHPGTATAIATRLGFVDADDGAEVLTGAQLDDLSDHDLGERIERIRVFARTNPEQKLRIVDAWKSRGAIVAMTGDGVNDAPALRRADIGVAMGVIGTDVSKEAADMVLADDDFATIVHAVEEGRRIYDSIRRFVRYLLSTNSGEIWVMFLAELLGMPLPLLPIQILWINLVTDGLPAIALGLEPAEPGTMRRRPRAPDESILAGGLWQHAVWVGLLMAAIVLPLEALARAADWPWQTMVFATVAFLQLGHALAVRSERRSLWQLGVRSNPWIALAVLIGVGLQLAVVYVPALQEVFDVDALTLGQLAIVLVLSTIVLVAVEVEKLVRRRRA